MITIKWSGFTITDPEHWFASKSPCNNRMINKRYRSSDNSRHSHPFLLNTNRSSSKTPNNCPIVNKLRATQRSSFQLSMCEVIVRRQCCHPQPLFIYKTKSRSIIANLVTNSLFSKNYLYFNIILYYSILLHSFSNLLSNYFETNQLKTQGYLLSVGPVTMLPDCVKNYRPNLFLFH